MDPRQTILDYIRRVEPGLQALADEWLAERLLGSWDRPSVLTEVTWGDREGDVPKSGLLVIDDGRWRIIVISAGVSDAALSVQTTLLGRLDGVTVTRHDSLWTDGPHGNATHFTGLELSHRRLPGRRLQVNVPPFSHELADGRSMTPDQHKLWSAIMQATGHSSS